MRACLGRGLCSYLMGVVSALVVTASCAVFAQQSEPAADRTKELRGRLDTNLNGGCDAADQVAHDYLELARRTEDESPPQAVAVSFYLAQCFGERRVTTQPTQVGGLFEGGQRYVEDLNRSLNSLNALYSAIYAPQDVLVLDEGLRAEIKATARPILELRQWLEYRRFSAEQIAIYSRALRKTESERTVEERFWFNELESWRNSRMAEQ